ncbi:MAG: hypothetical protein PHV60_05920 [bacterium]|nr:hypothetical protein [bacterium]
MKKILLFLCFLLLINRSAGATQARLDGFGLLPSWAIEEDDSLIWYNPVYISNYPDYLWAELGESDVFGNADSSWGGISYGFKDSTRTVGLFLAKPYTGDLDHIADFGFNSAYTLLEPKTKIDLFYGLNSASFPKTGIRINYASDHNYAYERNETFNEINENKTHSDEFNLFVGTQFKEFGPFNNFDIGINAGKPSAMDRDKFETIPTPVGLEDMEFSTKKGYYLGLSSRGIVMISEKADLITAIAADFRNIPYEYSNTQQYNLEYKYNSEGKWRKNSYLLGTALNSKLNEKALMVLALSYNRSETKDLFDETTDSFNNELNQWKKDIIQDSVPVNIGLEMNIWPWLIGRMGIKHDLLLYNESKITYTNKTNDTISETKTITDDASNATVSFGFGINIKDTVKLDLVIRKDLFFNGTYIVSGVESSLATEVSLLYLF